MLACYQCPDHTHLCLCLALSHPGEGFPLHSRGIREEAPFAAQGQPHLGSMRHAGWHQLPSLLSWGRLLCSVPGSPVQRSPEGQQALSTVFLLHSVPHSHPCFLSWTDCQTNCPQPVSGSASWGAPADSANCSASSMPTPASAWVLHTLPSHPISITTGSPLLLAQHLYPFHRSWVSTYAPISCMPPPLISSSHSGPPSGP